MVKMTPMYHHHYISYNAATLKQNLFQEKYRMEAAFIVQASAAGDASTVGMLLSQGARVDVRDGDGDTPLIKAAYFGRDKVCKLLLDFGEH